MSSSSDLTANLLSNAVNTTAGGQDTERPVTFSPPSSPRFGRKLTSSTSLPYAEGSPGATSHPRGQRAIVWCVRLVEGSQYLLAYMFSPFFPGVAKDLGMTNNMTIGAVFAIYSAGTFLATPLVTPCITRYGSRKTLLIGLAFSAGCTLLFGWLPQVASGIWFQVICLVVRAVNGAGAALADVGCFVVATHACPENRGSVLSSIEVAIGVGCLIGPPLGGVLFSMGAATPFGSFAFPFVVCSLIPMGLMVAIFWFMPDTHLVPDEEGGVLHRLLTPSVCLRFILVVISSMVAELLTPILPPHLQAAPYQLSVSAIGGLFGLWSAVYFVMATPLGMLIDWCPRPRFARGLMALGYFLLACGFMLLGHELLGEGLPPTVPSMVVTMLVLGFGTALALIPSLPELSQNVPPEDEQLQATISSYWSAAYALGNGAGPFVAGLAVQFIGFDSTCLVVSLTCITCSLVMLGLVISAPRTFHTPI